MQRIQEEDLIDIKNLFNEIDYDGEGYINRKKLREHAMMLLQKDRDIQQDRARALSSGASSPLLSPKRSLSSLTGAAPSSYQTVGPSMAAPMSTMGVIDLADVVPLLADSVRSAGVDGRQYSADISPRARADSRAPFVRTGSRRVSLGNDHIELSQHLNSNPAPAPERYQTDASPNGSSIPQGEQWAADVVEDSLDEWSSLADYNVIVPVARRSSIGGAGSRLSPRYTDSSLGNVDHQY
jgi:hypothetical protein